MCGSSVCYLHHAAIAAVGRHKFASVVADKQSCRLKQRERRAAGRVIIAAHRTVHQREHYNTAVRVVSHIRHGLDCVYHQAGHTVQVHRGRQHHGTHYHRRTLRLHDKPVSVVSVLQCVQLVVVVHGHAIDGAVGGVLRDECAVGGEGKYLTALGDVHCVVRVCCDVGRN